MHHVGSTGKEIGGVEKEKSAGIFYEESCQNISVYIGLIAEHPTDDIFGF